MSKKVNKSLDAFTDSDIVIREATPPEIPEESAISQPSEPTKIQGYVFEDKPIPSRAGKNGRLDYSIGQLPPGSSTSFLVPVAVDRVKQVLTSIRTFAYRNKYTVALRVEDGGIRVWRTEPKS